MAACSGRGLSESEDRLRMSSESVCLSCLISSVWVCALWNVECGQSRRIGRWGEEVCVRLYHNHIRAFVDCGLNSILHLITPDDSLYLRGLYVPTASTTGQLHSFVIIFSRAAIEAMSAALHRVIMDYATSISPWSTE